MLLRLIGIDVMVCPQCGKGKMRLREVINPLSAGLLPVRNLANAKTWIKYIRDLEVYGNIMCLRLKRTFSQAIKDR